MDNANIKYVIVRNVQIGQGAFSKVFLGHIEGAPDKRVAVKEININNIKPSFKERFYEEMDIMSILQKNPHENIIKCHLIRQKLDKIYFIMEYCESGELTKLIDKDLKEDKIKYYFKQLIEAFLHLDKLNIIHRDIKPANILLTNGGNTVKMADFGLSKIVGNTNMLNTICGTPFYMSPQILNQEDYNRDSDIWSLGIILYELVYNRHPFSSVTDLNDLKTIVKNEDIEYPSYTRKNYIVSSDCHDLMKSMLDKNLKTRIKLSDVLKHPWFANESHHGFVDIDKTILPKTRVSTRIPMQINSQIADLYDSSMNFKYMPGSAPNPRPLTWMDSIWNIGTSTVGYISKIGSSLVRVSDRHTNSVIDPDG